MSEGAGVGVAGGAGIGMDVAESAGVGAGMVGVPEATAGASQAMTEEELLALLDAQSIPYQVFRHDPIFSARQPVPPSIPRPGNIVKNLLLETPAKDRRLLATLRASARADLAALSRALGCGHLSFVPGDQMMPLLGVAPGSATPFALIGHANDAELVLDAALPKTLVCCHPMHNAASIELACDDMTAVLQAAGVRIRVVPFAETASDQG